MYLRFWEFNHKNIIKSWNKQGFYFHCAKKSGYLATLKRTFSMHNKILAAQSKLWVGILVRKRSPWKNISENQVYFQRNFTCLTMTHHLVILSTSCKPRNLMKMSRHWGTDTGPVSWVSLASTLYAQLIWIFPCDWLKVSTFLFKTVARAFMYLDCRGYQAFIWNRLVLKSLYL